MISSELERASELVVVRGAYAVAGIVTTTKRHSRASERFVLWFVAHTESRASSR